VAHIMRGKARYEQVAQHAIRKMYLDNEPVEGISERIIENLQRLSGTEGMERSEVYAKIAGDAILGVVGKKTSK